MMIFTHFCAFGYDLENYYRQRETIMTVEDKHFHKCSLEGPLHNYFVDANQNSMMAATME